MIAHFPVPLPDELLYSVFARLGSRLGHLSWQDYGRNILGAKTATGIVDLPNRLSSLVDALPLEFNIDMDVLIDEHTLWPYYAAFLPPDRRQRTREEMSGAGQPHVIFRLIASRGPRNDWLRYCTECAKNDRRKFGRHTGTALTKFRDVWFARSTAFSYVIQTLLSGTEVIDTHTSLPRAQFIKRLKKVGKEQKLSAP